MLDGLMKTPARRWGLLTILLVAGLFCVVLATFGDYGITWDEGVQHRYGRRLVRWYASLGADDGAVHANDLYFYGGLFELIAQLATRLSPLGVYETRHLLNALFGLVGVIAAWGLGSRIGGPAAGFFSALLLALTPSFYGHAFANPKDIPLASLMALAAWAVLRATDRLPHLGWTDVLTVGTAIGLASGVRVAGIVMYGYAALLWLACFWLSRRARRGRAERFTAAELGDLACAFAAVVVLGWALMVALWPWAQVDPLGNPFRALQKFSRFRDNVSVFFEGQFVLSRELPRYYILKMLALKLPESYAFAWLLGAAALVWSRRRPFTPGRARRAIQTIWVAALGAAPLAWIVVRQTPLYNGLRHVLFVVPFLAVLAGVSLAAFLRAQRSRLARALAVAAFTVPLLVAAFDMVQLHPYEYVYYNRLLAGGLAGAADRYEAEYWCASYKEAIEWTVREYGSRAGKAPIRIAGYCSDVPFWYYLPRLKAEGWCRVVSLDDSPDLVLVPTTARRGVALGRVVHVVERQGVPLLHVIDTNP